MANFSLAGSKTYQVVFQGGSYVNVTTSSGLTLETPGIAADEIAAGNTGRFFYRTLTETLSALGIQANESNVCYIRDITSDPTLVPNPIEMTMASGGDLPWVVAARRGDLWDIGVAQTTDFSAANGAGYYEFTDASGSSLTYTVPGGKKAFLRWISASNASSTMFGTLAIYIGSTLYARMALTTGGGLVATDLTSVCALNGGYIPAASVIKLMVKPNVTNVDMDVSLGGWLES